MVPSLQRKMAGLYLLSFQIDKFYLLSLSLDLSLLQANFSTSCSWSSELASMSNIASSLFSPGGGVGVGSGSAIS